MDILRIFRMQEPVSKTLLAKKQENSGEYKEVVQEKKVLIRNNKARIKELEEEVAELKLANQRLETRLKASAQDDNSFQRVMFEYDDFFKSVWNEREELIKKGEIMDNYLENLEISYSELLEKFQRAKDIILEMKENQDLLLEELNEYKEIITILENKYDNLKRHSESTIEEANIQMDQQKKENMEEMAKLKSKIIQRQAKINELEKRIRHEDAKPLLAPLRNKMADM
ncbi:general vesicular transport factor p115-like isoform X2 [Diorhabda carinulata]|uniref:general vesicular transport factor p115-like isoform X2 n=1 Tax=Diorhabda carinulata TaxID=1163345 RepID=UPI0025A2E6CB|nr:general vesicular transport factor p115-like isoform X2 [Diorhabda carinulata]